MQAPNNVNPIGVKSQTRMEKIIYGALKYELLNFSSSDGEMSRSSDLRIPRLANVTANTLFKLAVPLVRSEMTDMRDSVVLGLGSVNPSSLE